MPAIPKKKTSQTVWIATWDHKHGVDMSVHTTEEGAGKQCAAWARGSLEEWATPEELDFYTNLSDDDLISKWGEISGETEFFEVRRNLLHGPDIWDEVWDEAKDEPKVSEDPKKKTWKELFPESTLKPNSEGQLFVHTGVNGLGPEIINQLRDGAPYFQELAWTSDGELIIQTGRTRDSIKTIDVFEVEKD